MYRMRYAEHLGPSTEDAKDAERKALDKSVKLLNAALLTGPRSDDGLEALHFVQKLWTIFIEDLGNKDNALPPELRASLISIGFWFLKESEAIRIGTSDNIQGLIDVTDIIRHALPEA